MKKFIYNLALTCFLVAVSLGLLAVANRLYFENDAYLLEFPVKQQLIKDTPSPKVVILGGSNVAFGLDSKTISDSLHVPVINAGLHAGLGLRFIMDNNIPFLRKGDVLVIMPEYDHFVNVADGEPQTSGMIPYFASVEEMLRLNKEQAINVLRGFGRITVFSFVNGCKDALLSLFGRVGSDKYQYKKSGFNEVGDEVSHLVLQSDFDMYGFTPAGLDGILDCAYVDEFTEDVHGLERYGVHVVLLPPAIYDASYRLKAETISLIGRALAERGVPFQAETSRFAYPVDMMYNTGYHLNKQGVTVNTRNVIESLRNIVP